jgi:hypothetical protein
MIAWKPESAEASAERKPRRALLLIAECETADGQSARIRVRNLSASGMGARVDDNFNMIDGEPIKILFRGHRAVSGLISWVRGKSFGVTFDRLVEPDDIRQAAASPSSRIGPDSHLRCEQNQ